MNHTVIVTGSRNWTDKSTLWKMLDLECDYAILSGKNLVVRHGACPTGADQLTDEWYFNRRINGYMGISIERFPADWSIGKFAGPKRNREMVDLGADIVLAFPLGESRGTRGTINYARKQGLIVKDCS